MAQQALQEINNIIQLVISYISRLEQLRKP